MKPGKDSILFANSQHTVKRFIASPVPNSMRCFENSAGYIVNHGNYVRLVWHPGERADSDIMEVLNRLLEIGQQQGIDRLLVDQGLMSSSSVEVEVWFKYDWLSRARLLFDFGAAAILSSQNLLVRLATEGMLRHLLGWAGTFQIRVFSTRQQQEAIVWLTQHRPLA